MSRFKGTALFLISMLLFTLLSACSVFDGSEDTVDQFASAEDQSIVYEEANPEDYSYIEEESSMEDPVMTESSSESTAGVAQEGTAPVVQEDPDMQKFAGEWVDMSDSSRYAKIEKTQSGYTYSDNESSFPAAVKDGVLQIHIEVEDAYATGEFDEATGILTIRYQDTETQFQKKEQGG